MKVVNNFVLALFFFYLTIGSAVSLYIPKSLAASEDVIVIPDEAIRLRILANSNGSEDQEVKRMVRDAVNEQITEWVSDLTSIDDARQTIVANLQVIEQIVENILLEEGITYSYQVDFAKVQFPTKLYGNFLYPAGEYEAVLITLGNGIGANWWCVLFPPLCFLDFSTGSAVSPGFEDEEEPNQEENFDKENEHLEEEQEKDEENEDEATEEEEENEEGEETVYVEEEEVKVKFFVVELFEKLLHLFS